MVPHTARWVLHPRGRPISRMVRWPAYRSRRGKPLEAAVARGQMSEPRTRRKTHLIGAGRMRAGRADRAGACCGGVRCRRQMKAECVVFTVILFALFGTLFKLGTHRETWLEGGRETLVHPRRRGPVGGRASTGRRWWARRRVLALRRPGEQRQIERLQLVFASYVTVSVAAGMSLIGAL